MKINSLSRCMANSVIKITALIICCFFYYAAGVRSITLKTTTDD